MEFKELLEKRRSVRMFQERTVPVDLIDKIIEDATKASSAANNQPWQFIVMSDKKLIRQQGSELK